jgi:acetyltransferase
MLESLFTPNTIAIIGTSRLAGKFGNVVLTNLIDGGFKGTIVPINPNTEEILGLPCWSDIKSYPDKIDLSIIIIAQPLVLKAVNDSIDAGAKAVIINSTGFKEFDEEGAVLEEKIAATCTARKVALLGPNCLGLINTDNNLNALHGVEMPASGPISMISQSSTICTAFLGQLKRRNLGAAKIINTGNKAQLSEIDLFKVLGQDSQTKIITAYLENISSGDEFVKSAEDASLRKPLIILKSASSEAGRRAAAAHNGAVISTDTAYGAAFKRAGVIRAETLGDLLDLTAAFATQPLPAGNRVLVITNAGAPGIMAIDALSNSGLCPGYLNPEEAADLHAELPAETTVYNPIDLLADAPPGRYDLAIKAAMASENIDAVIVILANNITCTPTDTVRSIIKNTNKVKPLLVSFFGDEDKQAKTMLQDGGVPVYNSPEQAVSAIKSMHEYVTWKQRPSRVVTRFRVNRRRVERIIFRKLRAKRTIISEAKAKDILQAYDFHIPSGSLALSADEAVDIAAQIGYPVVMKIVSGDITHKSDVGGVKLNLNNRQDVIDAYDLMMLRVEQRIPEALIDGIYVEKMLDSGMEVALGMNRDPRFGPMLMFGLGGIFVEQLKDVAFHLAPITFAEAVQMLTSTKAYKTMLDSRGKDAAHLTAIAQCLQKISQLCTDFPQISELAINPLIIGEPGTEPIVVDARLKLKAIKE